MARSKKPSEKQAFPQQRLVETVARIDTTPGLTDRQWFAGLSLLGFRASGATADAAFAAKAAFADADAMLSEQAGAQ